MSEEVVGRYSPRSLAVKIRLDDIERIARDPEGVRRAIQTQPKLHRYIEKMPRWLVGAARRVERDYRGDASAIWSNRPSAVELAKSSFQEGQRGSSVMRRP